jgi:adenylate kinase
LTQAKDDKPTPGVAGRRILIVTGTPGTGKSTISKLLASRIEAGLIPLGDLVEKEKLHIGVDRKRNTLVADMGRVQETVQNMIASSDRDMVIEGHYAVDVVSPEDVYLAFVLRRDPQELEQVLRERQYREEKVRENLAAEILDVCLYDAVTRCGTSRVCEVDITGRKAEDVVEEIVRILDGKGKCRVGLVDWLGRLELEGKLDEYLGGF